MHPRAQAGAQPSASGGLRPAAPRATWACRAGSGRDGVLLGAGTTPPVPERGGKDGRGCRGPGRQASPPPRCLQGWVVILWDHRGAALGLGPTGPAPPSSECGSVHAFLKCREPNPLPSLLPWALGRSYCLQSSPAVASSSPEAPSCLLSSGLCSGTCGPPLGRAGAAQAGPRALAVRRRAPQGCFLPRGPLTRTGRLQEGPAVSLRAESCPGRLAVRRAPSSCPLV